MVHRSAIAADAKEWAVQKLRDIIGERVYPIHRLDRKTSGVLIFCTDKTLLDAYYRVFRERKIDKLYHAIVRGYTDDSGSIDYELKNERGQVQPAVTDYRTISRFEIPVASGKHTSSRYSLLELKPLTGRMHQIRKHMAHIFHPIIGDRPHGCNKQNALWKNHFELSEMLLHAKSCSFNDPISGHSIEISASYQKPFAQALKILTPQTSI